MPDLFRTGREVVVEGTLRDGDVRREAGDALDEVPLEVRAGAREEIDVMAGLGRAALLLSFGLIVYALVAGSFAAWKRRRRLALSAQNALIAAFGTTLVAAARALGRALARTTSRSSTSPTTRAARCRSGTGSPRSGAGRRARCSSGS